MVLCASKSHRLFGAATSSKNHLTEPGLALPHRSSATAFQYLAVICHDLNSYNLCPLFVFTELRGLVLEIFVMELALLARDALHSNL